MYIELFRQTCVQVHEEVAVT